MPDAGAKSRVVPMERLRQRADFVAAAAGAKVPAAAFVLQGRQRRDDGPARFGFTVARKVGTAVERNRVRRRLKEMVRLSAVGCAQAGYDYVLIGRRTALGTPFERLVAELEGALQRLHAGRGRTNRGARSREPARPAGDESLP